MSKLKILIILSLVINTSLFAQTSKNIKSLSAVEFKTAIDSGNYLLIDVRTPAEFVQGHIRGAINMDMYDNSFSSKIKATIAKNKAIAIYCRSGNRSKVVISTYEINDIQIIELIDGIIGWQQAGFKLATNENYEK